jgi:hypothetical protein
MPDTEVEPDAVDLLVGQHTALRALFAQVESSASAARADSFHRLVCLLAVHETADEQVVHPLTWRHVHDGRHLIADRLAEARRIRQELARLARTGADAAEFPRLLADFRATVLGRANHEEAYEFRYLRRDVPAGELRELSTVVRTVEAVAPLPRNTDAGGMSLFSRTKDLARKAVGDLLGLR